MRIQENNFFRRPAVIFCFFFEVFISMGGIPKNETNCFLFKQHNIDFCFFAFTPGLRCGGGRYLLPRPGCFCPFRTERENRVNLLHIYFKSGTNPPPERPSPRRPFLRKTGRC